MDVSPVWTAWAYVVSLGGGCPHKVAKWNVGKLSKDKSATMTGTMSVSGPKPEESPPIQLSWKVRESAAAD